MVELWGLKLLGEGALNAMLGVIIVLGVNAASQQTLFIVSGSPFNPMLREVNSMLCWGS